MDPAEARRFLPFKPHDQTSNQRLVYEQMISPENQELFLKTVKEGKEEGWEVILDRMVCCDVQHGSHPQLHCPSCPSEPSLTIPR